MKITAIIFLLFIFSCEKGINDSESSKDYLTYGSAIKKGLIAYYPFDGNAKDYGGNEYNGLENGPTASIGRFGQPQGALRFNGVDDYIEIPNFSSINSDSGTICFWVKTPGLIDENRRSAVISKIDTVGFGYELSLYGNSDFWFEYKIQNLKAAESMRTNYWKDETYLFLAVSFSAYNLTYYFEGVTTSEITFGLGNLNFNSSKRSLFIGRSLLPDHDFFQGDIDDLLIYDRVLGKDEIWELYNWKY